MSITLVLLHVWFAALVTSRSGISILMIAA